MKKIISILMLSLTLTAASFASGVSKVVNIPVQVSFIQTATTASFKPIEDAPNTYALVLTGVNPVVAYFADRPHREYGHLGINRFLATWDAGTDSFESDAPNAVVSGIIRSHGELKTVNVVVELASPKYDARKHTLTYQVRIIDSASLSVTDMRYVTMFIDGVCLTCIGNGG